MKLSHTLFIICLLLVGCGHENPPEVVKLLNEIQGLQTEYKQLLANDAPLEEQLANANRQVELEWEILEIDPDAVCPEWWPSEEWRGKSMAAYKQASQQAAAKIGQDTAERAKRGQ